jgi:Thiamine pyrophosphokinase
MSTKTAFLLLNGQAPKTLPDLSKFDVVCATDGAYNTLKEHQITPDFISGDLDSITQTPKDLEVIHTPDQNFTDFDKILAILFIKNVTKVAVYGASGKAQDHFLGNLHTAVVWKKKLDLTFYDDFSHYFLATKKTYLTDCKGKIISLVPFNKAKYITTKRFRVSFT